MKLMILFFSLFLAHILRAQGENYKDYDDKIIIRSTLGIETGSFNIKHDFGNNLDKIAYKSNTPFTIGIEGLYKWLSAKVSFSTPIMMKNDKFGKTNYFDFRLNYLHKNYFFEFDFHKYVGYTARNIAPYLTTSPTNIFPHLYFENLKHQSLSLGCYQLLNKNLQVPAIYGITSQSNRRNYSYFVKYTLNFLNYSNRKDYLIPEDLFEVNNTKMTSYKFKSTDFGGLFGIAFNEKFKDWQVSIVAGMGAVIQSKGYITEGNKRHFLGLSPRYDLKFITGYNVDKWFLLLQAELDNKSIRFNDLKITSNFFSLQLSAGIRLEEMKKYKLKNLTFPI